MPVPVLLEQLMCPVDVAISTGRREGLVCVGAALVAPYADAISHPADRA
jgi:hypothetical protein